MKSSSIDEKIAKFIDSLSDVDRSRFAGSILVSGVDQEEISGRYYVYFLIRPNGFVFYIGKGTGKRIHEHEWEARIGEQSHKCHVIRQIWDEGERVIKQKIAFFEKEEDAYALEVLLIRFFGRENLTNQRDGGEGGSVAKPTTLPKKNIERDAYKFLIRHRTYLLLLRLAKQDQLPISHELDILMEQQARKRLNTQEFAKALAEGQKIADHRRQEAETHREKLLQSVEQDRLDTLYP